jgi:DNA-binding NarL/FixJ family response regulator
MIRVLLADDNVLCRAGLRTMVDAMPGVDVIAEVSDGTEALSAIERLHPDVALLSISDGVEVATRVGHTLPRTRTILLSASADDENVRRARAGGVHGYLPRSADRNQLESALRAVDGAPGHNEGSATAVAAVALTPRLRQVLELLAEGLVTKEIAQRLGLSARTVEKHRAELMQRLGIHSVAGLVRYAMRAGIVRSGS